VLWFFFIAEAGRHLLVRFASNGKAGLDVLLLFGQNVCSQAQQVGQRDAPPVGGFGVWFFIKVRRLRLAFVGGAPL